MRLLQACALLRYVRSRAKCITCGFGHNRKRKLITAFLKKFQLPAKSNAFSRPIRVVPADFDAVVSADGPGIRVRWVRGSQHLATRLHNPFSLPNLQTDKCCVVDQSHNRILKSYKIQKHLKVVVVIIKFNIISVCEKLKISSSI